MFPNVLDKLHRSMSPEARERACRKIIDPSRPSGSFYLLVCLSAIIATFGLLAVERQTAGGRNCKIK